MKRTVELTTQEEQKALGIISLLEAFQAHNPTMPIQMAASFLTVARNEGKNLKELGRLCGVAQSTMSRHLLDLGERNRRCEAGLGLVEGIDDRMDLRRKLFYLTPKGKRLFKTLMETKVNGCEEENA